MKKFAQRVSGVTLLEVMLVLAVAAMIIVMSVRYYQSAQAKQQATDVVQTLTAIMTAADSMSIASGNYKNVTSAAILGTLPNGGTLPWTGGTITAVGDASGDYYTVTVTGTPAAVCPTLYGQVSGNSHVTNVSTCTGTAGNFSYQYNLQPH